MRGGEKVLDALCEMFPDAPLYTLVRVPGSVSPRIEARPITPRSSSICPSPAGSTVTTCRSIRSPSSCGTSPVRPRHQQQPLRSEVGEGPADDGSRLLLPLANAVCLGSVRGVLRSGSDRGTEEPADAADHAPDGPLGSGNGVTGSTAFSRTLNMLRGRIGRYYNRRSAVVHPPVDTDFYTPESRSSSGGFLIVSALVPYKRLDVAIEACRQVGSR